MPWITFSPDHVKARIAALELEDYDHVSRVEYDGENPPAVPPSSLERLPQVIEQVCNRFRFAILANPNVTTLGPAGTLPEGLIYSASVIARDALIAMPPTEIGATNPRKIEHDAAEKELEAVRSMNSKAFAIDEPAAPGRCGSYGGAELLNF